MIEFTPPHQPKFIKGTVGLHGRTMTVFLQDISAVTVKSTLQQIALLISGEWVTMYGDNNEELYEIENVWRQMRANPGS
jgi:hypothetical protein